jgi:hypothetical protein
MYARVASWEGGTADEIKAMVDGVNAADGPPEGVPAKGIMFLVDREGGKSLSITLFDSEDDMRTGDATLNRMSPPEGSTTRRSGVEMYEVAVERRL